MPPVDHPLLLVGLQKPALPALAALEHRALALVAAGSKVPPGAGSSTESASAALEGLREVELHGPPGPIEAAARTLLAGRRPAAVVALAERSVLAAARLRATFLLPGNSPETALACADKVAMKRAMDAAGVPVARWCELGPETRAEELIGKLGLPLVIKPRRDSGGRGQEKLADPAAVERVLARLATDPARETGFGWLAEAWIEGVEMSVETFVARGRPVFGNPTEYLVPRHANILPALLSEGTWNKVGAFVARALAAAGVERGITHVELFRTAQGLVFGELAIRPPGGRLMTLLKRAWGFDPWRALLQLELGETPAFPAFPLRCAGVWILHPGEGRVRAIEGLERAREVPHVRRIALKVEPGDTIPPRLGSGQDVGALYAEAPTRDEVATALTRARELLGFDLQP